MRILHPIIRAKGIIERGREKSPAPYASGPEPSELRRIILPRTRVNRGVRWRRSSQKLKLLKNSLEHRDYRGPRYHLESLGEVETNSLLNHYSLDAPQLDLHSLLHAELDVAGTAFKSHPCHAAYRE